MIYNNLLEKKTILILYLVLRKFTKNYFETIFHCANICFH